MAATLTDRRSLSSPASKSESCCSISSGDFTSATAVLSPSLLRLALQSLLHSRRDFLHRRSSTAPLHPATSHRLLHFICRSSSPSQGATATTSSPSPISRQARQLHLHLRFLHLIE
ncbi:hypothetical protein LXL04_020960, partial [Taraxacum kok-saghyz]